MERIDRLLSPLQSTGLSVANRVVMAPMSRRRSPKGIPTAVNALYYEQRAGAGLIIAENTAVTPNGIGYLHTPGLYNAAQIAGWRKVTDAVHAKGGKIFVQLVHAGRIGHPLNHEGNVPLDAPSAVQAAGSMRTPGEIYYPIPEPVALSAAGVQAAVNAHIQAAKNAIEAGFDGIEIHGAHGFLPEQFLHPHTNRRNDEYNGSIEKRSRFLLEIVEGTVAAIGKDRTGIRLSPFAGLSDLPPYDEELETYQYLTGKLQQLGILYIHLSDQSHNGRPPIPATLLTYMRTHFKQLLILAGGYTASSAEAALRAGQADLIAFGRPFIANPDLVERFRQQAALSEGDKDTFYQGGDEGYIDYPLLQSELCRS